MFVIVYLLSVKLQIYIYIYISSISIYCFSGTQLLPDAPRMQSDALSGIKQSLNLPQNQKTRCFEV